MVGFVKEDTKCDVLQNVIFDKMLKQNVIFDKVLTQNMRIVKNIILLH